MAEVDFKGKEAAWNHLFHIVRDQFPYSKMKDLTIKDGAGVSYKEIQFTFFFGRGVEPPRCMLPETFDDQWRRFMRFCQEFENGIVGEVHFTDGRPVLVSMQQPGMDLYAQAPTENNPQGGEVREQHPLVA